MTPNQIAVCLITCDRPELTARTLETFTRHNTGVDFMKLQADDASKTAENIKLGKKHGFELAVSKPAGAERMGNHDTRRRIILAARKRGAKYVLILENDWISVRPVPLEAAAEVFQNPAIYAFRLFGVNKELSPDGLPCRRSTPVHRGKDNKCPGWKPLVGFSEPLEVGDIHWGTPPTITRIGEVVWLHEGTRKESEIRTKCGEIDMLTARVVDNVVWHIGYKRTDNFKR